MIHWVADNSKDPRCFKVLRVLFSNMHLHPEDLIGMFPAQDSANKSKSLTVNCRVLFLWVYKWFAFWNSLYFFTFAATMPQSYKDLLSVWSCEMFWRAVKALTWMMIQITEVCVCEEAEQRDRETDHFRARVVAWPCQRRVGTCSGWVLDTEQSGTQRVPSMPWWPVLGSAEWEESSVLRFGCSLWAFKR